MDVQEMGIRSILRLAHRIRGFTKIDQCVMLLTGAGVDEICRYIIFFRPGN